MTDELSPSLLSFIDAPDAFLQGTWNMIRWACNHALTKRGAWDDIENERRFGLRIGMGYVKDNYGNEMNVSSTCASFCRSRRWSYTQVSQHARLEYWCWLSKYEEDRLTYAPRLWLAFERGKVLFDVCHLAMVVCIASAVSSHFS